MNPNKIDKGTPLKKDTNPKEAKSDINMDIKNLKVCKLAPFNRDDIIIANDFYDNDSGIGVFVQYLDSKSKEMIFEEEITDLAPEIYMWGLDAAFDAILLGNGHDDYKDNAISRLFHCLLIADPITLDTLLAYGKHVPKSEFPKFIWLVLKSLETEYETTYFDPIYERLLEIDPESVFRDSYLGDLAPIARLPAATKYSQFRQFFKVYDESWQKYFDKSLAMNPEAPKFEEFKQLFKNKDLWLSLALNPGAALLPEYAQLFDLEHPNTQRLMCIALNPNAVQFPEFKKLKSQGLFAFNPVARSLPENADLVPLEYGFDDKIILKNLEVRKYENYDQLADPHKLALVENPILFKEEYLRLFTIKDDIIQSNIASNPNAIVFKEDFKRLFSNPDINVQECLASNKNAAQFEEYRLLFKSANQDVLMDIAANPNAVKFEEYRQLFTSKNIEILKYIAGNPNAVKFDEFRILFSNENKKIQTSLVLNPSAICFPEFENLFSSPHQEVLFTLSNVSEAGKFESFKRLLIHKDPEIRIRAASNPNASRFEEFGLLFHDYSETILSAVRNKNAANHLEFQKLFTQIPPIKMEEFWYFSRAISKAAANPNAVQFPEYKSLFKFMRFYTESVYNCDSAYEQMQICLQLCNVPPIIDTEWINAIFITMSFYHEDIDETIISYKDPNDLFGEADNFFTYLNRIMAGVASNPSAVQFDEYKLFFNLMEEEYVPLMEIVANNINACKLPEFNEYIRTLWQSPNHKLRITAKYPNYVKDPVRRRSFYINRYGWSPSQKELADHPELYDCPEYRKLFYDIKGIEDLAKNPEALRCPDFKKLFESQDIHVRIEALRTYYNHLNEQLRRFGIPPSAENTPKVQACEHIANQIDKLKTIDKNTPEFAQILTKILKLLEQSSLDPIPQSIITSIEELFVPKNILKDISKDYKDLAKRLNLTEDRGL